MILFCALVVAISLYLCYRQYQRWEQYREDLNVCEAIKIDLGTQLRDLLKASDTMRYPEITKICTSMTLTREPYIRLVLNDEVLTIKIELRRAETFINVNRESITELPVGKGLSKLRS